MQRRNEVPVSVVIPCYRCASTINRAVESVLRQVQKPAEVILVDDASGDGTLSVLRHLEQQYPGWVKVIALEENSGAASARNAGWAAATQHYIAFLDADDAWHALKIKIQYTYMSSNPDVMLCGHRHRILKQRDDLPNWIVATQWEAEQINKWDLLLSNRFVTPSVMLRRDVVQRFAEKQHYMEDHLLWLEIACGGGAAMKLSAELTAIYKSQFGASGLSSHMWGMERSELHNYWRLHKAKYIGLIAVLMLWVFSMTKYLRRLIIVSGRGVRVWIRKIKAIDTYTGTGRSND